MNLRLTDCAISGSIVVLMFCLLMSSAHAENLKKIYIGEGVLARVTDKGITGPFPDILHEAARRIGQEIEIIPIPWRRGQLLAQTEPGAGAATVTRVPSRESLYVWVEEYMPLTLTFFVKTESPLNPKSIMDLRGVRVAVESGAVEELVIKGLVDHGMDVVAVSRPELIPKMMQRDRVDGWLIWDIIGLENFHQQNMLNEVRRTFNHVVGPIYLVTNNSVSEANVKKWQGALSELKADGSIQRILKSYYGDLAVQNLQ